MLTITSTLGVIFHWLSGNLDWWLWHVGNGDPSVTVDVILITYGLTAVFSILNWYVNIYHPRQI